MSSELLLAFWLVSLALVMTPGADWAYAIATGMRGHALLPAIGGLLLGYIAITLAVTAGVGALVSNLPVVLTILTVVGALYLAWLGLGLLRNPPVPTAGGFEELGVGHALLKGFGISGLNPKALLLFLALLPQFTSPTTEWPISLQIAVLGVTHMANCAVVYTLVGHGARVILAERPQTAQAVGRLSGGIMMVLAIVLVVERFHLKG